MERNRIGWARSAVSRAAKRVGGTALSFKFTLLCACVGFALAWLNAEWLLRAWLGDDLGRHLDGLRPHFLSPDSATAFDVRIRVAELATALSVVPIFAAEAWLLLCDLLDARFARRLALALAFATAVVLGLDLLAVRAIPPPRVILLSGA